MLRLALLGIFAALATGQVAAQEFLQQHRGKTVFIEAFPDANKLPTERRAAGSGVLLKGGYVLTARHFGDHGKLKGPDAMYFQGRIGDAEASPLNLSYYGDSEDYDLLVLKFEPGAVSGREFACLRSPHDPAAADEAIIILGYPQAANVTAGGNRVQHSLAIRRGTIDSVTSTQLQSGITITYGHSGSPVLDADGRVVGIVRGELKVGEQGTGTAVLIPIEQAESILPAIAKDPPECRVQSGAAQPANGRTKLLVGEHLSLGDSRDWSNVLIELLRRRISLMPAELSAGQALEQHILAHSVVADTGVIEEVPRLSRDWNSKADSLALVAGMHDGNDQIYSSLFFVGPKIPQFDVDYMHVELQERIRHTQNVDMANLLIYYAMIREAERRGLDKKEIVNPLLEKSMEIAATLHQQYPDRVVDRIRADLERLKH